jgi:hypothetical protein
MGHRIPDLKSPLGVSRITRKYKELMMTSRQSLSQMKSITKRMRNIDPMASSNPTQLKRIEEMRP